MCILHHYPYRVETIFLAQGYDFRRHVVGHQEFRTTISKQFEQFRMINLVVDIEPPTRALASCSVRRVRKNHSGAIRHLTTTAIGNELF